LPTTITYHPDRGISFGDTFLAWGIDRQKARDFLNDTYEIGDTAIDFSENHNGDTSHNINQRRDIYKNYRGQDNFFFLNFDLADHLIEIEIHHGLDIICRDVTISFAMAIEEAAALLNAISRDKLLLSEGEYLFKNLKLTIASSEAMGGNGKELSYFYCTNDISHLIDNSVCS
jgi:hypothetical protein